MIKNAFNSRKNVGAVVGSSWRAVLICSRQPGEEALGPLLWLLNGQPIIYWRFTTIILKTIRKSVAYKYDLWLIFFSDLQSFDRTILLWCCSPGHSHQAALVLPSMVAGYNPMLPQNLQCPITHVLSFVVPDCCFFMWFIHPHLLMLLHKNIIASVSWKSLSGIWVKTACTKIQKTQET